MTIKHLDGEERATWVDKILEELRLHTEDLHELAKHATEHAARNIQAAKDVVAQSAAVRARVKAGKKP